jgi:hypothetical protein
MIAGSIAFVPPTSMIRLFAFGGVLACVIIGIIYMDRGGSNQIIYFCAACQCGVALYSNYFLLLIKATPPPGSSIVKRLIWAVDLVSNPRGIGTSWQIRNLPAFSKQDPNYVPSRRRFILQRLAAGLMFYAVVKLYYLLEKKFYIANLRDGDYSEEKESIIRRIGEASLHELFVRSWLPFSFFFTAWCRHQYLHSFVSASAVALGDEPRRWPPLYGDIRDAYSIRQFWGYVSTFFEFPPISAKLM